MRSILSFIGIVIAAAVFGIDHLCSKSPEDIGFAAFAWFAFPYVWVACIASFVILALVRCRVAATLCAVALCLTLPKARQLVSVFRTQWSAPDSETLKFASLNVEFFDSCRISTDVSVAVRRALKDQQMADIISQADIVCLQETNIPVGWDNRASYIMPKVVKAINSFPHQISSGNSGGFVTLSRYPITWSDVCANPGTLVGRVDLPDGRHLTVYNCHFQSIMLSHHEIGSVSEDGVMHERSTLVDVAQKMSNAFNLRAPQVREVSLSLARVSGPVVLCGDFNDTPVSYTYSVISSSRTHDARSLSDAFVGSGAGVGRTYLGFPFPLRIDHVFVSDDMSVARLSIPRVDVSDHRPVCFEIR